jgi:hypothetical protein
MDYSVFEKNIRENRPKYYAKMLIITESGSNFPDLSLPSNYFSAYVLFLSPTKPFYET